MLPFIHIGRFDLPTYGICVAVALLVSVYVVAADLRRRGIEADANVIVGFAGLAGLVGSRIYAALESPSQLFASPWQVLFSRTGFTWMGAFLAGLVTLTLIGRHYKISPLRMLDVATPAAALGYGIGRIGCLISGDGDYGIPTSLPWGMSFPNGIVPTTDRVHPTPIYEFLAALLIFWLLWRMDVHRTRGRVFAAYLLLTGIARFLVEFIRLNPPVLLGLTNAQIASLVGMAVGAYFWFRPRRAAGHRHRHA